MKKKERYDWHLLFGFLLTLVVWLGLTAYWLGENNRLAEAAGDFAEERVSRGRTIYVEQCGACHGMQGEGGVGPALNDRGLLKNTLDAIFFSVTRSGVPNTQMPAWSVDFGGPLTDEDIRDVVAFIRAWEPTAPEIEPVVFEPSPEQGALLFATTCAVCHGENGVGGEGVPAINDADRLEALSDDWYRATIANGRPAKGMPTWGTVLSPAQIEDLVALFDAWRRKIDVRAAFSVTDLLDSAIFSLQEGDLESAVLHVDRARKVATGPGARILSTASVQLADGDSAGALATLEALSEEWPMGDATTGASVYSINCAPCHGVQGEGGVGPAMNPNEFVQANNNADMVTFILAGRPGTAMAGFNGRITDQEIADVVAFLRLWQP